ncbi:uncharacterized protein METZ01_LOCUS382791, partial [marine metagenome]
MGKYVSRNLINFSGALMGRASLESARARQMTGRCF